MIYKLRGYLLRYSPLSGMDGSNGLQELPMHLSLQQITSCSRLDGSDHLSIAAVRRQNDDPGTRKLLLDFADCLDAVQAGQLDIHERDIRSVRSDLLNGFLSTGRLRHQLHVAFSVDQGRDPSTKKRMVVHRKNPDQARVEA